MKQNKELRFYQWWDSVAIWLSIRAIRQTASKMRDEAMQTRSSCLAALTVAAVLGVVGNAVAQVYPSRPVTMIVPLAAGGPTDTLARIFAEGMRVSLGQPVIVENVTGASATIGVGKAARAAPDGYTVSIGNWFTHVLNGAVHSLQYDVLNDFEPVSLLADNPLLIVGRKNFPAQDLKELIAWLKANPNKASEGTSGVGSASHVSGVFFQKATDTHFQFVPYRGAAPAMQDLVAGQIDLMFDQVASSLPYVRDGKIKGYAITAKTRSASAVDIPTVDEAGLSGFYISIWHALWVPKGTPNTIVAKLNAAVRHALADPDVRARLATIGQEGVSREQQTPETLGAFQKAEIEKWWPIIRAANIKTQ
jgi:tripartite-type tricarboxylate transporter receptor subunit TctC